MLEKYIQSLEKIGIRDDGEQNWAVYVKKKRKSRGRTAEIAVPFLCVWQNSQNVKGILLACSNIFVQYN